MRQWRGLADDRFQKILAEVVNRIGDRGRSLLFTPLSFVRALARDPTHPVEPHRRTNMLPQPCASGGRSRRTKVAGYLLQRAISSRGMPRRPGSAARVVFQLKDLQRIDLARRSRRASLDMHTSTGFYYKDEPSGPHKLTRACLYAGRTNAAAMLFF
jgi:hypothetical protein